MFTGLSAFPLTPFEDGRVSHDRFARLVAGLDSAGVDSIGALGSTGSYAYLDRAERREAAHTAVQAAGSTPVIIGVGGFSTRQILHHVEDATEAGAAGLLVSVQSYQPLSADEIYSLFERVNEATELPIVLYDNPGTTGTVMAPELYTRIAQLPRIASIKIPGIVDGQQAATDFITALKQQLPESCSLGISGDGAAARGLIAGCTVWYSVLAGVLPNVCLQLTRAVQTQQHELAHKISSRLDAIWQLFTEFGSNRTVSAIAAELDVLTPESLHHPVSLLDGHARERVRQALAQLEDLATPVTLAP